MFLTLSLTMVFRQSISGMASTDHRASNPNCYHFESYFSADFCGDSPGKTSLNGVPNLVAYLNFPKGHHIYGTLSVTLTGGYNWQPTHGILCKRFHLIYHAAQGLVAQTTEITDSSGLLPSQWKIDDFDANTLRIPIYHLVATGNIIIVKVEATTIHEYYPSHDITISDPVVVNNTDKP